MKKFFVGLIVGVVVSLSVVGFASNQEINIIVNGERVETDVPPQIIDGRTMVPIRFVAEAFGAEVSWDPDGSRGYGERSVIIERPGTEPAPEPQPEPDEGATLGEHNALESALNYLDFMAFSYDGLVSQLKYEGYTHEEAVYAADNCGADWNEQAALKAKEYLDVMSFSRDGLIEQLEFEGFTRQQAEYGVKAVGY